MWLKKYRLKSPGCYIPSEDPQNVLNSWNIFIMYFVHSSRGKTIIRTFLSQGYEYYFIR